MLALAADKREKSAMWGLFRTVVSCGVLGFAWGSMAKESVPAVVVDFSPLRVDEKIENDPELEAMIAPYRKGVAEFSREVIGYALEDLNTRKKPENAVSNLVADAMRQLGSEAFEIEVDVAISNFGGLRRNLDKGPVTVGLVTELSPFENFLVLVEGKGELVLNIARQLAKRGGEPMSGMELLIGAKGELLEVTVGGKEIDPDKMYRVVTLDYLYGVDKGIWQRDLISNTTMSGTPQRASIIEYMKRLKANGGSLSNSGDGRIRKAK